VPALCLYPGRFALRLPRHRRRRPDRLLQARLRRGRAGGGYRPLAALQLPGARLEVAAALSCRRFRAGAGAGIPGPLVQPLSQRELWVARGARHGGSHRQGRAALRAVSYPATRIEQYENTTGATAFIHGTMKVNAGVRIIASTIRGPLYLNRNTQIGPGAD